MGTTAQKLTKIIETKAALKTAIEAKDVIVGDIPFSEYPAKIDSISSGGSIIVGTGQFPVTFYDYDGTVLKIHNVNSGESAVAPINPTHQYLTFAEWNNDFDNVTSPVDVGAIYDTTDDSSYLFISLTVVTGLSPTLNLMKTTTSEMTINWGDGTVSTTTKDGDNSISHTYSSYNDYIIKVSDSTSFAYGLNSSSNPIFGNSIYTDILKKVYFCSYNDRFSMHAFYKYKSIRYISIQSNAPTFSMLYGTNSFGQSGLIHCNIPLTITGFGSTMMGGSSNLRKIILSKNQVNIGNNINCLSTCYSIQSVIIPSFVSNIQGYTFINNFYTLEYIITPITPPTLNITAFGGINGACIIYVPDASLIAYKTATNWVTYADYIYPMSSYINPNL